ncbi:hypothetical protein JL720_12248 [Aureococcus anophagefferens]|nr:hypothetical protein JL720_12248 [Aureococcus anophagefferens]
MATDLTLEFKRICASMPQPEARAASPPPARTPPYVRAFTAACDDVGALTARTRASLAELGDLVRRGPSGSAPLRRGRRPAAPDGTVSSGGGVSGVGAAQQQQQQLIPDDQYAVRRADASQQIEAQVAEISSIFGRVSQLIKDQNESVERIEFNVEAADADVESAQEALLAKLGAMSSNTATALKVGGIVCATLVAYILII